MTEEQKAEMIFNKMKGNPLWLAFYLFMFYWAIATMAWSWRNPTANTMTAITFIGHVLAYEKMEQFQVYDNSWCPGR